MVSVTLVLADSILIKLYKERCEILNTQDIIKKTQALIVNDKRLVKFSL